MGQLLVQPNVDARRHQVSIVAEGGHRLLHGLAFAGGHARCGRRQLLFRRPGLLVNALLQVAPQAAGVLQAAIHRKTGLIERFADQLLQLIELVAMVLGAGLWIPVGVIEMAAGGHA